MNFRQKHPVWGYREYTINNKGVDVHIRTFFGSSRKFYDFHVIGKILDKRKERGLTFLILALGFLGYGLWHITLNEGDDIWLSLGSFGLTLVSFLCFLIFSRNYMYMFKSEEHDPIKFLDDRPSRKELMAFIEKIKKAQRIKLQQLYLTINADQSYEDYKKNIQWLYDNDLISYEEAEKRLVSLESNM